MSDPSYTFALPGPLGVSLGGPGLSLGAPWLYLCCTWALPELSLGSPWALLYQQTPDQQQSGRCAILHAPQAQWDVFVLDCPSVSSGPWSSTESPPICKSGSGWLGLAWTPSFLRTHVRGVPGATLRHLGPNLGTTWAILAGFGDPTWDHVAPSWL